METIEFIFTNIKNILLLIITLAVLIIAIRVTFAFNINEYLKTRKNNIDNKIKNYCPHAYISISDKQIRVQSSFISPIGTSNYICEKCHTVVYSMDENREKQRIEGLVKNFDQYKKQERRFEKLLKKGGYI